MTRKQAAQVFTRTLKNLTLTMRMCALVFWLHVGETHPHCGESQCIRWGDLGSKSYQMGVHGLICVSLGVLDVNKFGNHWYSPSQCQIKHKHAIEMDKKYDKKTLISRAVLILLLINPHLLWVSCGQPALLQCALESRECSVSVISCDSYQWQLIQSSSI